MTEVKDQAQSQAIGVKYDEMPYTSKAFAHVSVGHLETIGKIFAINTADISKARVLDLGCGDGENLLNYALNYPKAEIIGVDLSKVEVERGQKNIDALGIKNCILQAKSITDIDKSYGEFDYIICHGVFSWVPKEVQDKILDIIGTQLKLNGVAFVSYNTLPGWNVSNSFRHMLQFHSRYFESNVEKVNQSRALLDFMRQSLEGANSTQEAFLEKEMDIILREDDAFLFHEYIEKGNTEFYFSDFMSMANNKGLNYLADAALATMYSGNLPKKAAEKLNDIGDIVRQEQYMDFVTNRRFRSTMLCKSESVVNRSVSNDTIKDMYFSMPTSADTPFEKVDFSSQKCNIVFRLGASELQCTVSHPITAAALYAFLKSDKQMLSLNDIKSFIEKNCKGLNYNESAEEMILTEIMKLIFSGVIFPHASKPIAVDTISTKPRVSDLVLYQLGKENKYITSQLNESHEPDYTNRLVMKHLNGKNTHEDLVKICADEIEKSGQHMMLEGKRVTDDKLKFKLVADLVAKALHFAKACGFLVG